MLATILTLTVALVQDLAIAVPGGNSRHFIFTNKEAGFFTGETSPGNTSSYHGWFVGGYKYLEEYHLFVGSRQLDGALLDSALVYPDRLVRYYKFHNTKETVTVIDSMNAVAVEIETDYRGEASIIPWVSFRHISEVKKTEYDVHWDEILVVRRKDWTPEDGRGCLGASANVPLCFEKSAHQIAKAYPKDLRRRAMVTDFPYTPGKLKFVCDGRKCVVVFAVGRTNEETVRILKVVHQSLEALKEKRRLRMDRVLESCYFETSNPEYTAALRWAILSIDGLMMNYPFRGIYAGLFRFPAFSGRDTFISLAGACLAVGRFEMAREIIASFTRYQRDDGLLPRRLPSIFSGEIQYDAADVSHWFVRSLAELVQYSGDREILRELFPAAEKTVEDALTRMDADHLLTHGEAETWMDGRGESSLHSPRGNRAVEIEALWYNSLTLAAELARLSGKPEISEKWREISRDVKSSFESQFWNRGANGLFDHVNVDDSKDVKKRPNQLLAITAPREPLLSADQEYAVLNFIIRHLLEPHGVLSLSRDDPEFHPYHIDWDRYHFDEAYHNGDVPVWLAGPMIDLLVKYDERRTAWQLTLHLTDVVLHKGAVGTLPELENGVYLAEEENLEGEVSHALSLAEYIRVFYQDYLGVKPDAPNKTVHFEPTLPEELEWVRFRCRVGESHLDVEYEEGPSDRRYSFFSSDLECPWTLQLSIRVPDGERIHFSGEIQKGERLTAFVKRDQNGKWKLFSSTYRID